MWVMLTRNYADYAVDLASVCGLLNVLRAGVPKIMTAVYAAKYYVLCTPV